MEAVRAMSCRYAIAVVTHCQPPQPSKNSQKRSPTLHGGSKLPRRPSSSLQTAAIAFAIWACCLTHHWWVMFTESEQVLVWEPV